MPGAKQCAGELPQTCDANGAWQAGTACGGATTCVTGACSACSVGSGDCDHDAANACETNTNTSATNCSACAKACNSTNGTANCTAGVCGITCAAGYGNCDNVPANGCEVNLQTSPNRCGTCATVCNGTNGTASCTLGACGIICAAGHGNCDSNVANGCETSTAINVANCGTCGTVCSGGANGTASCTGGVCGITCTPGFANCDSNVANGCEMTGTCLGPPSCNVLAANCGPTSNENCCASALVPAGVYPMGRSDVSTATDYYSGGNYNERPEHAATIAGFRLDLYEVTVGRFRKYVGAYPGSKPAVGAGANPSVAGSGWSVAWASELATDQAALKTAVKCDPTFQTWRDTVGTTETLPMNCVNWADAFAFCAWDGGWLPTEAEWEKASAGGDENRLYPWGAAAPTASLAAYDCTGDGSAAGSCAFTDILAVGRKPLGTGTWGQYDLGGGMWEWVFDFLDDGWYAGGPCINCANVTNAPSRSVRGGSWRDVGPMARAAFRDGDPPSLRYLSIGFRCARNAS